MSSRLKRYRHFAFCPKAPDDIRGPLHRTGDPSLHKKRQEWIRERLLEDFTYKAISRQLGIGIPSVRKIIMTHNLQNKRTPSASYVAYHKLGLSVGHFKDAFDLAPERIQNQIMDHALDKELSLTTAAISLLSQMDQANQREPMKKGN